MNDISPGEEYLIMAGPVEIGRPMFGSYPPITTILVTQSYARIPVFL